jgi:hypothetical protein
MLYESEYSPLLVSPYTPDSSAPEPHSSNEKCIAPWLPNYKSALVLRLCRGRLYTRSCDKIPTFLVYLLCVESLTSSMHSLLTMHSLRHLEASYSAMTKVWFPACSLWKALLHSSLELQPIARSKAGSCLPCCSPPGSDLLSTVRLPIALAVKDRL